MNHIFVHPAGKTNSINSYSRFPYVANVHEDGLDIHVKMATPNEQKQYVYYVVIPDDPFAPDAEKKVSKKWLRRSKTASVNKMVQKGHDGFSPQSVFLAVKEHERDEQLAEAAEMADEDPGPGSCHAHDVCGHVEVVCGILWDYFPARLCDTKLLSPS